MSKILKKSQLPKVLSPLEKPMLLKAPKCQKKKTIFSTRYLGRIVMKSQSKILLRPPVLVPLPPLPSLSQIPRLTLLLIPPTNLILILIPKMPKPTPKSKLRLKKKKPKSKSSSFPFLLRLLPPASRSLFTFSFSQTLAPVLFLKSSTKLVVPILNFSNSLPVTL